VETSDVPEQRVDVVPSGIEEEWFRAAAGSETAARRPLVVFAGNLASYQGIDLLLRAFQRVAVARTDARLRIISDWSFASHYATARRLGILERIEVVHVGLDRLPRLLAEARLAVNPRADGEGAPQKVLNYMAAGLPTVCFAHGAAPLRHLETGWVAADGDLDAFAAGMLRLLEDPELAARLGAAARVLVRSQLGWDAAAQRTLAVYTRVLATNGPARVPGPPTPP
jgi:glycosyltransferase involved in cell wall biosynthesis